MSISIHPVLQPNSPSPWYWVLRGFIFSTSIAGNGLVVYLIVTRSRLNRVLSNWFVLSLAVADLLVILITIPEVVYAFFFEHHAYPWPLKLAYDFCTLASIFNLCALTFERYIAVVHPLKYTYLICNHRLVLLVLAVVWLTAFLSPLPCYICYRFQKFVAFRYLQAAYLFIGELLPAVVLSLAYIKMFFVVRKQETLIRKQSQQVRYNYGRSSVQINRLDKRNRSQINIIGAILLIFVVCYVFSFYKGFKNYVLFETVSNWSVSVVRLLYQVNSAVNWLVYALMKKDIKEEVKILMQKLRWRKWTVRKRDWKW